MIDSFALQLLHGGSASAPGVLTSEWVKGELIPFLRAFLKYGIGASTLLCLVLYAYERLRFDHDAAVRRAFAILWVAVYLLVVGIVVGGGWDKRYHAKNPFETFYSAPHLFVYASLTLATLLVVCLLIYYRPLFGSPTSLPGGLPASLGLLVAGLGLTAVGGIVLDNIWHTLWGLNETPFSTPHMMIDWGKLITLLGFGSAAIALAEHRAVSGRHRLLVGLLVVIFSITPIMGPFGQQLRLPKSRPSSASWTILKAGYIRHLQSSRSGIWFGRIQSRWSSVGSGPVVLSGSSARTSGDIGR